MDYDKIERQYKRKLAEAEQGMKSAKAFGQEGAYHLHRAAAKNARAMLDKLAERKATA